MDQKTRRNATLEQQLSKEKNIFYQKLLDEEIGKILTSHAGVLSILKDMIAANEDGDGP